MLQSVLVLLIMSGFAFASSMRLPAIRPPPSTEGRWTSSLRRSGSASTPTWGWTSPCWSATATGFGRSPPDTWDTPTPTEKASTPFWRSAYPTPSCCLYCPLRSRSFSHWRLGYGRAFIRTPGLSGDHGGQYRCQRDSQRAGGHRADLPLLRPAGHPALVGHPPRCLPAGRRTGCAIWCCR